MKDMAATHYLVERIESDLLTKNRMNVWRASRSGLGRGTPLVAPALPDPSPPLAMSEADADEIRRDAQGGDYRSRESSIKKHSEIMDDLMKLDAGAFRRKFEIIPERPLEVDAARNHHHAGAGGEREGDVGWGDFGQR